MDLMMVPPVGVALILLLWFGTRKILKRINLNRKLNRLMEREEQYEFLLCDIRSPRSYESGHIPGAVSFPLEEVDFLPVEDMFLTIIIYGKNNRDTRRAAEYLSRNGYFNVISYGGIRHWRGELERDRGSHISQIPPDKEPQNGARIDP
jgi:rhodanese-related sulfurtransferase